MSLREARPVVQGIFLLRFLTGFCLYGSVLLSEIAPLHLGGAASWISATVAVYVYNGAEDLEEDVVNGSSRPVARGDLGASQARLMAVLFGLLGLIGGLLVHPFLALGVALILVMGWLYSGTPFRLKRWPAGLASVAFASALLTYGSGYIVAGYAPGNDTLPTSLLAFAVVMALWMGLVGQTKDLPDVAGDKRAGRRSLPVTRGEDGARLLISSVALLLGVGFCAFSLSLSADEIVLPSLVVLAGGILVAAVSLGPWGRGGKDKRKRPYRMFMLTQYAANAAVIFTALNV